jgi:cephalosporin hydroxylase
VRDPVTHAIGRLGHIAVARRIDHRRRQGQRYGARDVSLAAAMISLEGPPRWVRRRFRPPAASSGAAFPAPAAVEAGASLIDHHRARLVQHVDDNYCGVLIQKFPEDLRVYEHLLWASRSNVVIELGCNRGGSTLWFRDRLEAMAHYGRIRRPRVLAIDIMASHTERSVRAVDPDARGITFLEHDLRDPSLPGRVAALLGPNDRPFVIEDSAHEYDTTRAALEGFAPFVADGGYLVVEDTVVDDEALRVDPRWPRGVVRALEEWLASDASAGFAVDRSLELYGITCHPGGFLRRGHG